MKECKTTQKTEAKIETQRWSIDTRIAVLALITSVAVPLGMNCSQQKTNEKLSNSNDSLKVSNQELKAGNDSLRLTIRSLDTTMKLYGDSIRVINKRIDVRGDMPVGTMCW